MLTKGGVMPWIKIVNANLLLSYNISPSWIWTFKVAASLGLIEELGVKVSRSTLIEPSSPLNGSSPTPIDYPSSLGWALITPWSLSLSPPILAKGPSLSTLRKCGSFTLRWKVMFPIGGALRLKALQCTELPRSWKMWKETSKLGTELSLAIFSRRKMR